MGKIVASINELTLPQGGYVLALPGWYPTWLDPMPGDFNHRHVKAAALYKPQLVLYIGKDTSGTLKTITTQYLQVSESHAEIIVLYPAEKWNSWDVIQSNATYIKLLYKYAHLIKEQCGLPQLLHCYIVLRGGLGGWLLARLWHLPYVLTENWTIYYPADPGYLRKRNIVFRSLVKKILKRATRFLPVTSNLNQQVNHLVGHVPFTIIPNVVDTALFHLQETTKGEEVFKFVHVSTMEYQKNPEGLLRAFKAFHYQFPQAKLIMVGPFPASVKVYAQSLHLTNGQVEFTGSVPYQRVAEIIKHANALVLFSRYENLPCVILEALCCGLPVISTDVGGISEVINETNGMLVPTEQEQLLSDALIHVFAQYHLYDKKKIAETSVERFSYDAVGQQMNAVYNELV